MAIILGIKIGAGAIQNFTLPVGLETAINNFLAAQAPKFVDAADLIIRELKTGLFKNILSATPPAALVAKQVIINTAQADLDATVAGLLP